MTSASSRLINCSSLFTTFTTEELKVRGEETSSCEIQTPDNPNTVPGSAIDHCSLCLMCFCQSSEWNVWLWSRRTWCHHTERREWRKSSSCSVLSSTGTLFPHGDTSHYTCFCVLTQWQGCRHTDSGFTHHRWFGFRLCSCSVMCHADIVSGH